MASFLNVTENILYSDGSGRFFLTCPDCQKEFQADFLIDSIRTEDQIPKNSFSEYEDDKKAFNESVEKLVEDQKITESSKPEQTVPLDEDDDEFPATLKTVLKANTEFYDAPHCSGGLLYIFDYILFGLCYLGTFLGYLITSILKIIIRIFGYLLGGKRLYHFISKYFFERTIDDVHTLALTTGFVIIINVFIVFILLLVNLL